MFQHGRPKNAQRSFLPCSSCLSLSLFRIRPLIAMPAHSLLYFITLLGIAIVVVPTLLPPLPTALLLLLPLRCRSRLEPRQCDIWVEEMAWAVARMSLHEKYPPT